jgi:hypothetical protein
MDKKNIGCSPKTADMSKKHISSVDTVPSASAMQNASRRPIWEVIVEISSQIPDEEWAKVPDDASINYKHYLYDEPRQNV